LAATNHFDVGDDNLAYPGITIYPVSRHNKSK